jgi:hypothetical protein
MGFYGKLSEEMFCRKNFKLSAIYRVETLSSGMFFGGINEGHLLGLCAVFEVPEDIFDVPHILFSNTKYWEGVIRWRRWLKCSALKEGSGIESR